MDINIDISLVDDLEELSLEKNLKIQKVNYILQLHNSKYSASYTIHAENYFIFLIDMLHTLTKEE